MDQLNTWWFQRQNVVAISHQSTKQLHQFIKKKCGFDNQEINFFQNKSNQRPQQVSEGNNIIGLKSFKRSTLVLKQKQSQLFLIHVNYDHYKIQKINYRKSQTIKEVFKDKLCVLGGIILKSSHSFGDFYLQKFQPLCIYANKNRLKSLKSRLFTIHEYSKDLKQYKNIQESSRIRLKKQYLAIYKYQIIHPRQMQNIYNKQEDKTVNFIVAVRFYLERLNYIHNKLNTFAEEQNEKIEELSNNYQNNPLFLRVLRRNEQGNNRLHPNECLAIFLYTQCEFSIINRYLRESKSESTLQQQRNNLPIINWIWKSINKINNFRGVAYRGCRNLNLSRLFELEQNQIQEGKIILFSQFVSTSVYERIAQTCAGSNQIGVVLKLRINTGKPISIYSKYIQEKEIILLPFTHFVINNFSIQNIRQTAYLQEVPLPSTNSNKLIFWVNNQQQRSIDLILSLQSKGIQLIEIVSTRIMKIVLKQFFWTFKMLGKKTMIISNMRVEQDEQGVQNQDGGVNLYEHINEHYGFSTKFIIYTKNAPYAYEKIMQRGQLFGNWSILVEQKDIFEEVTKQFENDHQQI